MMRIRRNDTVHVIAGRDKGKRGTVLDVDITNGLIKVAGIGIYTKHQKARRQGEVPAIKKQEGFINISNVMLVSPSDSKPTRVGVKVQEDGTRVRMCKRTKEILK